MLYCLGRHIFMGWERFSNTSYKHNTYNTWLWLWSPMMRPYSEGSDVTILCPFHPWWNVLKFLCFMNVNAVPEDFCILHVSCRLVLICHLAKNWSYIYLTNGNHGDGASACIFQSLIHLNPMSFPTCWFCNFLPIEHVCQLFKGLLISIFGYICSILTAVQHTWHKSLTLYCLGCIFSWAEKASLTVTSNNV